MYPGVTKTLTDVYLKAPVVHRVLFNEFIREVAVSTNVGSTKKTRRTEHRMDADLKAPACWPQGAKREFFIDNLLVRIHFIILMTWWTGLAPWEFEFPLPSSLTSALLDPRETTACRHQRRIRKHI